MSKIVSPYPPFEGELTPAPNASWWRIDLPMNQDDYYLVTKIPEDQSWVSYEFFDGCETVIDTGFDKPTKVRVHSDWEDRFIDVLHVGPPTPSPLWKQLTEPGITQNPYD